MTTLQSILLDLHFKTEVISRHIEGDGENSGIFERIRDLELQNEDIIIYLQRIENQLNVITLSVLEKKNEERM